MIWQCLEYVEKLLAKAFYHGLKRFCHNYIDSKKTAKKSAEGQNLAHPY